VCVHGRATGGDTGGDKYNGERNLSHYLMCMSGWFPIYINQWKANAQKIVYERWNLWLSTKNVMHGWIIVYFCVLKVFLKEFEFYLFIYLF
jgi:hypothetical protein